MKLEHDDFHFAQDLARENRPIITNTASGSGSPKRPVKKQKKGAQSSKPAGISELLRTERQDMKGAVGGEGGFSMCVWKFHDRVRTFLCIFPRGSLIYHSYYRGAVVRTTAAFV